MRRKILITLIILGVFSGLTAGSAAFFNNYYADRVYPGVRVGSYDFGGKTPEEVKLVVETKNNLYAKSGLPIIFNTKEGEKQIVNMKTIVASDNPESIKLNSEAFAELALSQGRTGKNWEKFWLPIIMRLRPHALHVPVMRDDIRLMQSLKATLLPYEDLAHDASIDYSRLRREPKIIPEKIGQAFDYQVIIADVQKAMSSLSDEPVEVVLRLRVPRIAAADVFAVLPQFNTIVKYDKMILYYVDEETKVDKEWVLDEEKLADLSAVDRNESGQVIFVLQPEKVTKYITDEISPAIAVEPLEAKFSITEGQVQEFQASRSGLEVDVKNTADELMANFKSRNEYVVNYAPDPSLNSVAVNVKVREPTVKTADVNSLGITDLIGVGISTFRDSRTNRIKNIAHAVKKLNGLLIKPGEQFSANQAAGPFTAANGYLPEAVIKGREIKPEVGGGMCQIGTTLFRMAMNSGMPITERHNHSLVVSYYADPVNHNPGTDATLYEPILDFKFLNDTGNYLLMQTSIDYKKQELRFALWGRPDGRSGSYTHPLVKRWIPAGEPETIYIDDGTLEPGQTKCQSAFRGAVATFTYTRTTTVGEKIDQTFDSYYRPLPKICQVGVLPGTLCNGQPCDQPASSTAAF